MPEGEAGEGGEIKTGGKQEGEQKGTGGGGNRKGKRRE
jgi:hypothetical protein